MPKPSPISPRVLHIIFDPTIPSAGGQKLHQASGWNNPDQLASRFIEDIRFSSYEFVNYQIAGRIEVDGFPVKTDGFVYDPDDYLVAWQAQTGFHQPDSADYQWLLDEFDIVGRINRGEIDEVWLSAFPYAGFYESRMAGPGAFWCNAPPLGQTDHSQRRFILMGFNYQRGVGEMLESMGHRAESILKQVYSPLQGEANLWARFTRYEQQFPGQAEVGDVHFAPNSERDYDWGNHRLVTSACDNWYSFPDLGGAPREVNCTEWGNGEIRAHHLWWLRHFPHVEGETDGVSHNWWVYVLDADKVPVSSLQPAWSQGRKSLLTMIFDWLKKLF